MKTLCITERQGRDHREVEDDDSKNIRNLDKLRRSETGC